MKKELLRQALDALENHSGNYTLNKKECVIHEAAIDTLRAAIAKPVELEKDIGSVYSIALQQAIESHCAGNYVSVDVAKICPYHSKKLDAKLAQPVQPVAWQERVFDETSAGNFWSNWWEVSIYDLKFSQKLASKNPTKRQIRPLYATAQPVQPVSNDEIEAAVLAERAACAILCEARYMGDNNREDMEARRCAAMIRARTK